MTDYSFGPDKTPAECELERWDRWALGLLGHVGEADGPALIRLALQQHGREGLRTQITETFRAGEVPAGHDLVMIVGNDAYGSKKCDEWPMGCLRQPALIVPGDPHPETGQILIRVLTDDGRTWSLGWIQTHAIEVDNRPRSKLAQALYFVRRAHAEDSEHALSKSVEKPR